LLVIFLFAFALLLVFQSTTIFPDPDSFYHAGVTQLIRNGAVVPKEFQWLPFTILGTNYIDHHYLYHVALIPFSFIHPLLGLKFATAVFGGLFVVVFAAVLMRLRVRFPELFVLLLMTHGPFLFRMNLVKAPSFSLLILFGMVYLMITKRWLALSCVSAVYVWAYDGWVVGFGVAGIVWVVRSLGTMVYRRDTVSAVEYLRELFSRESLALIGTVVGGMAFGIVVNPYFPSNITFYVDHIVNIGLLGYRNVIGVGGEWYGYALPELLGSSSIAMALFVMAAVVFVTRLKRQDEWTLVSLALAIVFFAATLRSQRHVEYFVPFFVLHIALAFRPFSWNDAWSMIRSWLARKRWVAVSYVLLFAVSFAVTKDLMLVQKHLNNGFPHTFLQSESQWIRKYVPKGEVVFHSNWDEFPALFFYNRDNKYVAGLDPAFLYARDKKRFFLWRDITQGVLTKNLAGIMNNEFGARFVLASSKHSAFRSHLESQGFIKRYEGPSAAIYEAVVQ